MLSALGLDEKEVAALRDRKIELLVEHAEVFIMKRSPTRTSSKWSTSRCGSLTRPISF